MTTLLDIGAHIGDFTAAVLPYDQITKIHCFEPSSECLLKLFDRFEDNPRVAVHPYGLYNKKVTTNLYHSGTPGASIYIEKDSVGTKNDVVEECRFRQASKWIDQNIPPQEKLYWKINCEGAEVPIFEDLLATNKFNRVTRLLIAYDAIKISNSDLIARAKQLKSYILESGIPEIDVTLCDLDFTAQARLLIEGTKPCQSSA